MKRNILLCMILIIAVVLCLTAVPARAEILSGACGKNLTWTLDDSGTLTISGNGPMARNIGEQVWYPHTIKQIVIEEGVTTIAAGAFSNLEFVTRVTIADSVTSIGAYAFSGCGSLSSIILPIGLTEIGGGAFSGCSALTSISIPFGIRVIYDDTFSNCIALTTVSIPETVSYIDNDAFENCDSLEKVKYAGGRREWNRLADSGDEFGEMDEETCLERASVQYNCVVLGIPTLDTALTIVANILRWLLVVAICVVSVVVIIKIKKRSQSIL